MGMNESDIPSSDPAPLPLTRASLSLPPARDKTKRFWNWKLIGIEIILVALAIYAFLKWAPRLPGMAGFVMTLVGVWLLSREFRGLSINSK